MKKKLMALLLSATMILGSSVSVFAIGPTEYEVPIGPEVISGNGVSLTPVDIDDIIVVDLSTTPVAQDYNMTLDPQGLLNIADSTKYALPAGAVYFGMNDTASEDSYTNESVSYNIISKSSVSLNASIKVDITDPEGNELTDIDLVEQSALATATKPSLYVGIMSDFAGTPETKAISASDNEVVKLLAKVPEVAVGSGDDGYELKVSTTEPSDPHVSYNDIGYGLFAYYELAADHEVQNDQEVTYKLTAECSTGDKDHLRAWQKVNSNALKTTVTYFIDKVRENVAPSIVGSSSFTAVSGTPINVSVSLGSGTLGATDISEVYYISAQGSKKPIAKTTGYTYSDGVLTLTADTVNAFIGGTSATRDYKIACDDAAGTILTVTLTK